MVQYGFAETDKDLKGILSLQKRNLASAISEQELQSEGFVTVDHDFDLLKKMNSPYPHIVAKLDDIIIGYTLVMLREMENEIPILKSMFQQINNIHYKRKLLKNTKYCVMGQVCIGKENRGKGIFDGLYANMKSAMKADFDFIITEVSKRNPRSLKAHYRAGFENVKEYISELQEEWVILLLPLNKPTFTP